MDEQLVTYTLDGESFDVFVAGASGEDRPAVLVVHAWGGRDAFAEGKARALAELGYVGAAIDLYGVGVRGTDRGSSQALMSALTGDPPKLRARLEKALEVVRGLDGVDQSRTAAIGFCFGGLCALLMARMGLELSAAVSFHGLLKLGERLDTRPSAKILVLHGQDDPMVPPGDVGAFAEEMHRVGGDWQLHAYPGVVHAFTNPAAADPDFGTVYDAEADRRSWSAMQRFLTDHFARRG